MSNIRDVDRDIEDLLPFYANGTLSPGEKARVDAALRADGELARRLALIEEERAEAIGLSEALGAPSPHVLDALMAKIEAEPKTAAQLAGAAGRGVLERFGAMLAALSPRTLAYATAAAIAVIALQGAALTGLIGQQGGAAYQTASAPEKGSFALVSFAPDARADEIAKALSAAGASIIEGPRASGLYRLRLGAQPLAKDEVAKKLAILRAARAVVSSADAEQ